MLEKRSCFTKWPRSLEPRLWKSSGRQYGEERLSLQKTVQMCVGKHLLGRTMQTSEQDQCLGAAVCVCVYVNQVVTCAELTQESLRPLDWHVPKMPKVTLSDVQELRCTMSGWRQIGIMG